MADVILHVGLPKTGSTFLQNRIFPNLGGTDVRTAHPEVIRYLARCIDGNLSRQDFDTIKKDVDAMLAGLAEPLIISHEGFCGEPMLGFFNLPPAARLLAQLFPDARVLITLRRQDTFAESLYAQHLQTYHWMKMSAFLDVDTPFNIRWAYSGMPPRLHADTLDWNVLVERFEEAFGADRVSVSLFEDFATDKGRYIERMSKALDRPVPAPTQDKPMNESYTNLSARVARVVNRFVRSPHNPCGIIVNRPFGKVLNARKDTGALYKALWRASQCWDVRTVLQTYVNRIPSKRFRPMTDVQRDAVLKRHAAGNAALDARRDLGMKLHGYH